MWTFLCYNCHCRPPTYPAPMQQIFCDFHFAFFLYSLFNVSSLCIPMSVYPSTCISSGVRWIIDLSWWKSDTVCAFITILLFARSKSNQKIIPIWLLFFGIHESSLPVNQNLKLLQNTVPSPEPFAFRLNSRSSATLFCRCFFDVLISMD
jgi:hypothetical protein